MNSSNSTTIKIRNSRVNSIKGSLTNNVSRYLSRFAQCIGRGFVEIYGRISNETLCKFFSDFPCDLPKYIHDTYFLLEEYPASVGLFIHINKNRLVFMASKSFLVLNETYDLIKLILKKIGENQFFKFAILNPDDIETAISITDCLPLGKKLVLQLEKNISEFVRQTPDILRSFDRISIYLTKMSPHITIDRLRRHIELFIDDSLLDKFFSIFSQAISCKGINTIEITVSDSPIIEKLLSILSQDMFEYIDYLWISADALRICRGDFSVTLSFSRSLVNDEIFLNTIQRAVKYLEESKVARIKIGDSGIVETILVNHS